MTDSDVSNPGNILHEEDDLIPQLASLKREESEPINIEQDVLKRSDSVSSTVSDPTLFESLSSPTPVPLKTRANHGLLDVNKILRCNLRFVSQFPKNEVLKETITSVFEKLVSKSNGISRNILQREYDVFLPAVERLLQSFSEMDDANDGIDSLEMLEEFKKIPHQFYCRVDSKTEEMVEKFKGRKLPVEAYTGILSQWFSFALHLLNSLDE